MRPWTASGRPLTLDCMVSQAGSPVGSQAARYPAAPVDPAGLAAALRPFGTSTMLPRAAYVDPAVFAWEQQNFFGGGWTCVGFSSMVARPGDQRAEPAGAGGVLLARDDGGILHAFANTCRHRGHELLPAREAAPREPIICPPSQTPAGTAAMSCCLPASRPSATRSSARTTPGPTRSTADCASRRDSSAATGSTGRPGAWPSSRWPSG